MAAVAHDSAEVAGFESDLDTRFAGLVAGFDVLPFGEVRDRCLRWRSILDGIEARRLAAEIGSDGDTSRARSMAAGGGARSKKAASDAARRAKAVAANSKLADDLESGDLSTEQLDTIADAAESDPDAAVDDEFIDAIKDRSVDQGRQLAKDRKNAKRDGESEHRRQRRRRKASTWKDQHSGLSYLQLCGDDATIDELWNLITQQEKQLREADGGRDLPSAKHPRTLNQRLFDAAAELLRSTGPGNGLSRPSIVITVPVNGSQPTVAGGGPLPHTAVAQMLAGANLSVMLVDSLSNQPLWHGRLKRHATTSQFLALVVRDGGCVQCGAAWIRCEAHHQTPFNAPARGETNINEMVLLCTSCHHQLHAANLTIYQTTNGTWKTRPATPAETPVATQRRATGSLPNRPRRTSSAAGGGQPTNWPPTPVEQQPPSHHDDETEIAKQAPPSLFRRAPQTGPPRRSSPARRNRSARLDSDDDDSSNGRL